MRVGSIFNVEVRINIILVALVVIAVFSGNGAELATIFLIFMAHETAHVLAAKALKMNVREIELLPFGGAVRIEGAFELNPINEIYIALAGPGMNILLLLTYSTLQTLGLVTINEGDLFIKTNIILAGFNLLPALPLDGGRVLRAVLAREIGMKRATNIAVYGGLALSLFIFMVGVYGIHMKIYSLNLFFISGFLLYSALKEKRSVSYLFIKDISFKRGILSKEGILKGKELVVLYDLPLKRVIKRFVPYRYHFVKVVDHRLRVWGYLDETQIVNGMMEYGANIQIGRLLKTN